MDCDLGVETDVDLLQACRIEQSQNQGKKRSHRKSANANYRQYLSELEKGSKRQALELKEAQDRTRKLHIIKREALIKHAEEKRKIQTHKDKEKDDDTKDQCKISSNIDQQDGKRLVRIIEIRRRHKMKYKLYLMKVISKQKAVIAAEHAKELEEAESKNRIRERALKRLKENDNTNFRDLDSTTGTVNNYLSTSSTRLGLATSSPKFHESDYTHNPTSQDSDVRVSRLELDPITAYSSKICDHISKDSPEVCDIKDDSSNVEANGNKNIEFDEELLSMHKQTERLNRRCLEHIEQIIEKRDHEKMMREVDHERQKLRKLLFNRKFEHVSCKVYNPPSHRDTETDAIHPRNEAKTMTDDDKREMVCRLLKKATPVNISGVKSFQEWKAKNGIPVNQKVFCMRGAYHIIREELLRRGWHFNSDHDSNFFDLKWCVHNSDVNYAELQPHQMVNHFKRAGVITTKAGLMHNIRNLRFFVDQDENSIFPRCYDFSMSCERCAFLLDYLLLLAKSTIQEFIVKSNQFNDNIESEGILFNPTVFRILLSFLERNRVKGDQMIDNLNVKCATETENEIILSSKTWLYNSVPRKKEEGQPWFDSNKLPGPIHKLFSVEPDDSSEIAKAKESKKHKKIREEAAKYLAEVRLVTEDDLINAQKVLDIVANHQNPQHIIDGSRTQNLWIVKPSGKSRGRGIKVMSDVHDIANYIYDSGGPQPLFVVQKYIENPLLIQKRKFDLRQWVLVTSLNPLTIWFFDECYVRIAVNSYEYSSSMTKPRRDGLDDDWEDERYRHLVNNSIAKNSENFHNEFAAENGTKVFEHMWTIKDFQKVSLGPFMGIISQGWFLTVISLKPSFRVKWLLDRTGTDKWSEFILPRVKKIVSHTLMCTQGEINPHRGCFELFGFDIMIDEEYNPWLIEVNSSPACDYSTSVTECYVKRALPDILAVVIDRPQNSSRSESEDDGVYAKVGGWECIYVGASLREGSSALALGADFGVKGEALSLKKNRRKAPDKYKDNLPVAHKENVREIHEDRENSDKFHDNTFDDSDLSEGPEV